MVRGVDSACDNYINTISFTKNLQFSNLFQLNQLENNMQKYNRIKRFFKVIQNKKSKLNDFKNSSLWLKAVVGKRCEKMEILFVKY